MENLSLFDSSSILPDVPQDRQCQKFTLEEGTLNGLRACFLSGHDR